MKLAIERLFNMAMKRYIGDMIQPTGLVLNLGAGNSPIPDTISLDLPEWDAMKDDIPWGDGVIDGIYAFHFFEHLPGDRAIYILRECQRVLKPEGLLTIAVPHSRGEMAFQDLDHKSFYTLETWRTLFNNPYYDKNREVPWEFAIRFNMLAAVVERNTVILTQLEKM